MYLNVKFASSHYFLASISTVDKVQSTSPQTSRQSFFVAKFFYASYTWDKALQTNRQIAK